jgi:protease I
LGAARRDAGEREPGLTAAVDISRRLSARNRSAAMTAIKDTKILIMATDGFEQSELFVPLEKLRAAGADVHIAAPKKGDIKGWDKDNWGRTVVADLGIDEVDADDYDALVLLRLNERAVELVLDFLDSEKIVAAICHAPWLLVEADAVEGRMLTSWPSVKTDIENAGGDWVDEEVVVDDNIITSRSPKDLDAFCAKIIEELEQLEDVGGSA